MKGVVGVLTKTKTGDEAILVVDCAPFIRLKVSCYWIEMPPEDTEHIGKALIETARRIAGAAA